MTDLSPDRNGPSVVAARGPIPPDPPEVVADRDALFRLGRLYALGMDLRDEAMVRSVFHPDAVLHGALGSAPVDVYVPQLLAGAAAYEATMHHMTNQFAVVDGDRGELWSYAIAMHLAAPDSGMTDLTMGVHYRDQVARGPEGWLITARRAVAVFRR